MNIVIAFAMANSSRHIK